MIQEWRKSGAVNDSAPQREMGPALRPTPLSPACGLPKERLTPGVSMPPGCSCEPRTAASPSPGARAGAGSDRGLGSIRRSLPPPGGSETDLSAWASNGSALPEGFAVPRRQTGKPGLSDFAPSRDQRFEISEVVRRLLPGLIPPPRSFRRRVEAVPKSLLPRRPFGLCLGRANPRLDDWKVRGSPDSGNGGPADLSTFVGFASGQGWITQRFAAAAPLYPLSRCASSRNRSALSLMKPAASCWS